eukprot:m.86067 g.86067  ORF g.86067 m.86067 type:complete len:174 (-) comp14451_c0_seq1:511-1032(-)
MAGRRQLALLVPPATQPADWVETARQLLPETLQLKEGHMGYGVAASRPIQDGEAILSETPDCFVLAAAASDRRCHGCLTTAAKLVPCDCSWSMFCASCQEHKAKFHSEAECAAFQHPDFDDFEESVKEYIRLGLRVWHCEGAKDRVQRGLSRAARRPGWSQWPQLEAAARFAQ